MNWFLLNWLLPLIPEEYKQVFIPYRLTANPKMTFLQVFEWFYDQHDVAVKKK